MSQAGQDLPPLPCGVSGIKVTNAVIREYDYTYYCTGSFNFQVSALFDTRPLSTNPADANKHRGFEQLQDGDTKIIANYTCTADPWGLADTQSCTPVGNPVVQHPINSFPAVSQPLPMSVYFLDDSSRQELAASLRTAASSPSGTNKPQLLAAPAAPSTDRRLPLYRPTCRCPSFPLFPPRLRTSRACAKTARAPRSS